MTSINTDIPTITSTELQTTTANNSTTTSNTLKQLESQVNMNATYDYSAGEEITDINGNDASIQSSISGALMTGSGPGKYIVQMNGKKYSIESKNAKKAASYVYRHRYRNKYILLYVNKINSNKNQVFKGICYKNNKKIVKEVNF